MTIEEMKAKRRALLAKAHATVDRARNAARDLTKAEQTEVENNLAEHRALTAELKARAAGRKSLDELGQLLADGDPEFDDAGYTGKGRRSFARFAEQFSTSGAKAFTEAGGRSMGAKAAMGSFTAGTPYVPGTGDEVIGPDPALGVMGLISGGTVEQGNNFAYLQELTATNTNNAAVVPDKALKPTSKKELVEIEDKLKVIAHLSEPIPNRYLDDYKEFAAYLETVMARDLVRVANSEIVNGTGGDTHLTGILNTSGVLAQAWSSNLATTLRKARTALQNKNEQPTAWLLNPSDIETIELFADANLRFQSLREIMGSLPMVPETSLAAGQAILGDWRLAKLMDDGKGTRLDATDSSPFVSGQAADGQDIISGNLFDHNMFKLRAEMRLGGLAISRPSGFVVVDLTV